MNDIEAERLMDNHSVRLARIVRIASLVALPLLATLLAACGKGTGGY